MAALELLGGQHRHGGSSFGWAPGRTPESPTSNEVQIEITRAYGLKPAPVRSQQFQEAEARDDRAAAG
jgi:hypothetical protein